MTQNLYKLYKGDEVHYMYTSEVAERYDLHRRTVAYYAEVHKPFKDGFYLDIEKKVDRKKVERIRSRENFHRQHEKKEETRIEMIARIISLYGNVGISDKEKNVEGILKELEDMGIKAEAKKTRDEHGKEHISLWKK